jgi:hypothetical protein
MKKIITINDCEQCRFVWRYLGVTLCCSLMNNKLISFNEEHYIPSWCPLCDATQEVIDAETNLITCAGLKFE